MMTQTTVIAVINNSDKITFIKQTLYPLKQLAAKTIAELITSRYSQITENSQTAENISYTDKQRNEITYDKCHEQARVLVISKISRLLNDMEKLRQVTFPLLNSCHSFQNDKPIPSFIAEPVLSWLTIILSNSQLLPSLLDPSKICLHHFSFLPSPVYNYNFYSNLVKFNLHTLSLISCEQLGDEEINLIISNSNLLLQSLRMLVIRNCRRLKTLPDVCRFVNLEYLEISEHLNMEAPSHIWIEAPIIRLLRSLLKLETLDLHATDITNPKFNLHHPSNNLPSHEELMNLAATSNLNYLDISTTALSNLYNSDLSLNYNYSNYSEYMSCLTKLYSFCISLPKLRHLDLSFCMHVSLCKEPILAKELNFLGICETDLTRNDAMDECIPKSKEYSGLRTFDSLLSSFNRYLYDIYSLSAISSYMFNAIRDYSLRFSNEKDLLIFVPLILDAIDVHLLDDFQGESSYTSKNISLAVSASAALGIIYKSQSTIHANDLTKRMLTTCYRLITQIPSIPDNELEPLCNNLTIILFTFYVESSVMSDLTSINLMHKLFYRYVNNVIEQYIEDITKFKSIFCTSWIVSLLRALYQMFRECPSSFKAEFGTKYGSISLLMRLVSVKLELKEIDDIMSYVTGILLNCSYLCFENCQILASSDYTQLYISLLTNELKDMKIIQRVVAIFENISEYSVLNKEAANNYTILPYVNAILNNSKAYDFDTILCSCLVIAYYAAGSEIWNWPAIDVRPTSDNEISYSTDASLNLALEVLSGLNFKTTRQLLYENFEILVKTLHRSEEKVYTIGLWIICNLLYTNLDRYYNFLKKEDILVIQSFKFSTVEQSLINKLSSDILFLVDLKLNSLNMDRQ